jgi:Tfp pilus assembly pilus retraction ATPase PilT
MQSGGKQGMQTMDASLAQLVRDGRVTLEDALACCHDEDEVRRLAGSRPSPVPAGAR